MFYFCVWSAFVLFGWLRALVFCLGGWLVVCLLVAWLLVACLRVRVLAFCLHCDEHFKKKPEGSIAPKEKNATAEKHCNQTNQQFEPNPSSVEMADQLKPLRPPCKEFGLQQTFLHVLNLSFSTLLSAFCSVVGEPCVLVFLLFFRACFHVTMNATTARNVSSFISSLDNLMTSYIFSLLCM